VVLHQHEAEEKFPEVGEAGFARELGGVRQPPGAEVQVGDGGAAEDCGGEKEVQRPWAVEKDELFLSPNRVGANQTYTLHTSLHTAPTKFKQLH
jgi:hypothetical protein